MKTCIIVPFHDKTWLENSLDNIARADLPAVFVLNGTARGLRSSFMPSGVSVIECSEDNQASGLNRGIAWATEQGFEAALSFDSDDYYGPAYAVETMKGLEEAGIVGRRRVYTKLDDGLHLFERPGRPFLFATVGFHLRGCAQVANILDSCGDWCDRMSTKTELKELSPLGYCYRRHGSNAHWALPSDVFVKASWGPSLYFGKQPETLADDPAGAEWQHHPVPSNDELLKALRAGFATEG